MIELGPHSISLAPNGPNWFVLGDLKYTEIVNVLWCDKESSIIISNQHTFYGYFMGQLLQSSDNPFIILYKV